MNKSQLKVFRIILFFLGLAVIGAAFAVINFPMSEERLSVPQKFLWAEVIICYLIFFVPFFFSSLRTHNIDTKMVSTVHLWICIIIFEIAAITLTILALGNVLAVRFAILIELIVFFLLAIFVFIGYFAGNHIGTVQAQEQKSLNNISELKSAFEVLNLKTDMLNEDFHEQKEKLKKFCDDVKFLSPVDSEQASSLEMKLIVLANVISSSNMTNTELNSKISELELLLKQRKLLRK